jgi:hypothetical protein
MSILMDASNLCPDGFSLFYPDLTPMQSDYTKIRKCSSVESPKYYLASYRKAMQSRRIRSGSPWHEADITTIGTIFRTLADVSLTHHVLAMDRA